MIYINGIGAISPIGLGENKLPEALPSGNVLKCLEPNYAEYINERLMRRMARIIKMSIAASSIALKDANIEKPDAIVTATGLGCLEDTEDFLKQLITENEGVLSPTAFIKSTHNTIGGQIALLQNNQCYNMTYSQRNSSFENALQDGMLLLEENEADNVLVGGIDELTDTSLSFLQKLHCVSSNENDGLAMAGEGASFLVIAKDKNDSTYCSIIKAAVDSHTRNTIELFLQGTGIDKSQIDVILTSDNKELISAIPNINYKQYCGGYFTSTAFACWLGALMIKQQKLPGKEAQKKMKYLLIHNGLGTFHSMILLQQC